MKMAEFRKLDQTAFHQIKELFYNVFTQPPWNDDWSDEAQLDHYLKDLMEVRTPLLYGLYENDKLIGVSIGNIRHWHGGTEYFIEEFFIQTDLQNQRYGSEFLSRIETDLSRHSIHQIFLMTERHKPAYDFYRKNGFEELKEHVSFFKEF